MSGILARLTRGSAAYGAATLVTRGIAFLLLPVYTRLLTPADYGVVSVAETVAVAIPMLGGAGLGAALQRLYFKDESPAGRRDTVATVLRGALVWLAVLLGLAFLVGERVIRLVAPAFAVPFFPYVAIAFGTAAANQIIEYRQTLFQCEEKSRTYALMAIAAFALNAACILTLLLGFRLGALGVLLGKLLGAGTFALVALALLRGPLVGAWRRERMVEAVGIGAPLVPHVFIALILGSADVLFIQAYSGVSEVGLYSIAYTMGSSVTVVTSTLMLSWSPVFYDLAKREDVDRAPLGETAVVMSAVMIGAATLGSAFAQPVIRGLLHERYWASAELVPIVMAGYVFHWFFSLFHLALIQAARTPLIAATTATAAAVNLGLNFVLIPTHGARGAALATLAAYVVEAIAMYVVAQRCFPIPYPLRRLALAVASLLVVVGATQLPLSPVQRAAVALPLAAGAVALLYWLARGAQRSAGGS